MNAFALLIIMSTPIFILAGRIIGFVIGVSMASLFFILKGLVWFIRRLVQRSHSEYMYKIP